MRYLFALVVLAALIFGGWPYYTYYRLDGALAARDDLAMAQLIDLDAVRQNAKAASERRLQQQLPGQDPVSALVRDGARLVTRTVTPDVTLDGVREMLRGPAAKADQPYPSLVSRTSFAFFESPTRFVARLGELSDPMTFVVMKFKDWRWRVTEVHASGS
jgi:hypothetical protein